MFLDGHNKLRSQHALGNTGGIFNGTTVADMATMVRADNRSHLHCNLTLHYIFHFGPQTKAWDDELELMSLHNAVHCQLIDDKCRRTFNYKTVGQNIHVICEKPKHISIGASVNEAITTWFSQYENVTDSEAVQKFDSTTTHSIHHFTQLVQSKADRIGCSIVRYNRRRKGLFKKPYKCILIVCNYSAGNLKGFPTYKIGAPTSQCQSGGNPDYPGLCSPREDYTTHENAEFYFTNAASPIVPKWVKNNKEIHLGGK